MLTKSIIWDIDGTVIDTRNAMASAYRVACEEMGLKEDNYRRIFAYVGQKSSKVFVDQFGLPVRHTTKPSTDTTARF